MGERNFPQNQEEENETKTFTIQFTRLRLETWKKEQDDHPVLHVPLKVGALCFINNLEMEVLSACLKERKVDLAFREQREVLRSFRCLPLSDVVSEDCVIKIGHDGEIVCRNLSGNGILHFNMALAQDVDLSRPQAHTSV